MILLRSRPSLPVYGAFGLWNEPMSPPEELLHLFAFKANAFNAEDGNLMAYT